MESFVKREQCILVLWTSVELSLKATLKSSSSGGDGDNNGKVSKLKV